MAGKLNLEIKVGIFVFIGLIIMTIAVFSISEIYLFRPGYTIKTVFGFASGLEVGAQVRVAGIAAGEVKAIQLNYDGENGEPRVTAVVWLEKKVKIPVDSVAYVSSTGLVGEQYLEIIPGLEQANTLKEGGVLIGRDPISTDTVMEILKGLAENANDLVDSLHEVFDEETKEALRQTVQSLRQFSSNMENVGSTLEREKVAEDLNQVLDSINEVLDEATKENLRVTIANLEQISYDVKSITGRLERGESKLGKYLKGKKKKAEEKKE